MIQKKVSLRFIFYLDCFYLDTLFKSNYTSMGPNEVPVNYLCSQYPKENLYAKTQRH